MDRSVKQAKYLIAVHNIWQKWYQRKEGLLNCYNRMVNK